MTSLDIKFMRLDRQYHTIKEDILIGIDNVLVSGQVLQSKHIDELEKKISKLNNTQYGVAVNSGTDALRLRLRACGVSHGDRVLTTPLSFVASSSVIISLGATPVYADVSEDMHVCSKTYIDIMRSQKIDALILVHLYGRLYDYSDVIYEANRLSIPIIEDCAQAFGATSKHRTIGQNVSAVCLSFDPMKVMAAYGSGGMVLTNNDHIDSKIRLLRYHGRDGNSEYPEVGDNSQLSSVQASILLSKLIFHEEWTEKRIKIAKKYNDVVNKNKYFKVVDQGEGGHVFHKYVLLVEQNKRNELRNYLTENGIGSAIHYSTPLHKIQYIEKIIGKINLPNAEALCTMTLSLPIYAELTKTEVDHICKVLMSFGN